MLDIGTIINGLSTIASAVERIQERKRGHHDKETSRKAEDLAKRVEELQQADQEQEQLLGELSENVRELAQAIELEIEKNRLRDARTLRLVYAVLILALIALAVSIVAFVR